MKIAVVYSLPTRRALASPFVATEEDTKASAEAVGKELATKGADVTLVPVSEDAINDVTKITADCIFNLIEWSGLDTQLAIDTFGALEKLNIPMTGPTATAFKRVANKVDMKKMLRAAGLLTPGWQLFESGKEPVDPALSFPVIVKPLYEHCSIGLTYEAVVENPHNLPAVVEAGRAQYNQPVYAEEFIIGREFQVTVLDRPGGLAVLPPAEILFDEIGTRAFLTYASRWIEDHPEYNTSSVELARLTPGLVRGLADAGRKAFTALGFADYSRLDIRVRNSGNPADSRNWQEDVYILEANANPGLEDDEAYGMSVSFHAAGMTFADFLWGIVGSCLRRKKES